MECGPGGAAAGEADGEEARGVVSRLPTDPAPPALALCVPSETLARPLSLSLSLTRAHLLPHRTPHINPGRRLGWAPGQVLSGYPHRAGQRGAVGRRRGHAVLRHPRL